MPWGRMNDKFHRSRKVRRLRRTKPGRLALGTWVFWWSWCLDDPELTGVIPAEDLDSDDRKAADLLVGAELWDAVPNGYRIHDFHDYNPTRTQVDAKKQRDHERYARGPRSESERTESETPAVPKRSESTRDPNPIPIPSHPKPNEARAHSLLALLSQDGCTATGTLVERIADWLAAQGLRRVDSMGHRVDLMWIGEQPAADAKRVTAVVLSDPWCLQRLGRCSAPGHLRKHWQRFLDGPEPAETRGMSAAPAAEQHNEPEPAWATK